MLNEKFKSSFSNTSDLFTEVFFPVQMENMIFITQEVDIFIFNYLKNKQKFNTQKPAKQKMSYKS